MTKRANRFISFVVLGTLFVLAFPGSAFNGIAAESEPSLRLRPNDGPPGLTSVARGRNFIPSASGTIVWSSDGTPLADFIVGDDGSFEVDFVIPDRDAGEYSIAAISGDDIATDQFEIERTDEAIPGDPTSISAIATPPVTAAIVPTSCPETAVRTIEVSDAVQLTDALAGAQPGDLIRLSDGDYLGNFTAGNSGTADARITVCGSRAAVINGGDSGNGYALHITGNYWTVHGITINHALKGVMLDGANFTQLIQISVHDTGHEAVHFRTNSSDNVISDSEIHTTGLKRDKFGEGVYVGSAVSNWGKYTAGEPDRSDRNQILRNTIWNTSSENIDIKEGTAGGLIEGNVLVGDGLTRADSWVDIKGNNYVIRGNTGRDSPKDGFQTHVINKMDWGKHNVFERNIAIVNGDGFGFYIHDPETSDNIVSCNNQVTAAESGFATVECT